MKFDTKTILIVAVVGLAAYVAYSHYHKKTVTAATSNPPPGAATQPPPSNASTYAGEATDLWNSISNLFA